LTILNWRLKNLYNARWWIATALNRDVPRWFHWHVKRGFHQLSKEQREQIEQRVTDLYMSWLYDLQQYQDDAEQAALIAELIVLYIKQGHLLNAAELLITYGWLCVLFGHIARIQRMFDEYAKR